MAAELMRAGRAAQALAEIESVLGDDPPRHVEARCWHLKGVVARMAGDAGGARRCQDRALAIEPALEDAAVELARLLNAANEPAEAIRCTEAAARHERPPAALLAERARAWQALDRPEERVAERRRIAAIYPGKAIVNHNLAAALGDAGHAAEAEEQARAAIALGGAAPETRLVLARALQSQNRLEEADSAFAAALALRPGYYDAVRDRAQLTWMKGAAVGEVMVRIEKDGASMPRSARAMLKAAFLATAGMPREGHDTLVAEMDPGDPRAHVAAATLALRFDAAGALAHARRAAGLAPASQPVLRVLADALLANADAAAALLVIEPLLREGPLDQGLIGARWTAWRLQDDPRAAALYDYDRFVGTFTIDPPDGWSSRDAFLADLLEALRRLHRFRAHPLDQSLRQGSQTASDLLHSQDPALRSLPAALAPAIDAYLQRLGQGSDILRARTGKGRRFAGMWSVRLRPGGRHLPHIHPRGWISSALHIDLPDHGPVAGREGWLEFGRPGAIDLDAQFHVRPVAGGLVLFPSYMWHSTLPFTASGFRTSIAFDIVPALPGA